MKKFKPNFIANILLLMFSWATVYALASHVFYLNQMELPSRGITVLILLVFTGLIFFIFNPFWKRLFTYFFKQ